MNEILLQELLSELSNVSSELKDISGELAEMNKILDICNSTETRQLSQQVILLNGIEASLRRRNLLYSYVHNIDPNRVGLQL